MNLLSEEIELLKELYANREIKLFYFHQKYLLSPAQLARAVRKFEVQNIIILHGSLIKLTAKGEKWIFANRKEIFLANRDKYWKAIPTGMQQERLKVNELYKPNRKNLDPELFNDIEDGKQD